MFSSPSLMNDGFGFAFTLAGHVMVLQNLAAKKKRFLSHRHDGGKRYYPSERLLYVGGEGSTVFSSVKPALVPTCMGEWVLPD